MTASAYVSGVRPRHTKDVKSSKMLKVVPTAALFGAEHVRVRLEAAITSSR